MKPSSAPARPAQLRKTPARWRRLADASGQPSLPPAFTDSSGPQFRPSPTSRNQAKLCRRESESEVA
jgi:hypothetical protein